MSGKSGDAYRTISEVAADLDLPQHVLRFWESRFPQIRPLKRGGGRRFYRPADVVLLRDIRRLLHAEGYTIKGVQRLLRERGGTERRTTASGEDDAGVSGPAGLINDEFAVGEEPAPEPTGNASQGQPAAADLAVLREALALIEACERRLGAAIAQAAIPAVPAPEAAPAGDAPPGP